MRNLLQVSSGGLLLALRLIENTYHVCLLHDQELLAGELDFGAGLFCKQHAVSHMNVERGQLTALVSPPSPHGNNLLVMRLPLRHRE